MGLCRMARILGSQTPRSSRHLGAGGGCRSAPSPPTVHVKLRKVREVLEGTRWQLEGWVVETPPRPTLGCWGVVLTPHRERSPPSFTTRRLPLICFPLELRGISPPPPNFPRPGAPEGRQLCALSAAARCGLPIPLSAGARLAMQRLVAQWLSSPGWPPTALSDAGIFGTRKG